MKRPLLGICLLIIIVLSGCSSKESEASPPDNSAPVIHVDALPEIETQIPETAIISENEYCAFSDGLDRFIECYNSCCTAHENSNLLKAKSDWRLNEDCWYYKQYEDNWLEPEYRVFVEPSGAIFEIRIGFEDHGFTEWGEALSEERTFYTLRCLWPEPDDDELRQLISAFITDMKTTRRYIDIDAEPDMLDPVIYGDYWIYHYFSGGIFQLCIIMII